MKKAKKNAVEASIKLTFDPQRMRNVSLSKDWWSFIFFFFSWLPLSHGWAWLSAPQVSRLATAVAPVARALYPRLHCLARDPLAVLGQAQAAHEVDEAGGKVQLAAKLAGGVVVGEGVVVVVESFTWTQEGGVKCIWLFFPRFFIINSFQNFIERCRN